MSVTTSYDQVAREYVDFYNRDLYSIAEDRVIAELVESTVGARLRQRPLAVADIGCGTGLPHVIWRRLFTPYDSNGLKYDGFDISPGMIETAKQAYRAEVEAGIARFGAGGAQETLPRLDADAYDLLFSLHGVLSHLTPESLAQVLKEVARVTSGHAVLSFLSRNADCRAPDHERRVRYECRQLQTEPFWVTTYTGGEVRDMLQKAGLRPVAIQGVGVKGADDEVHSAFVDRQKDLEAQRQRGHDVQDAWDDLVADIRAVIHADLEVARQEPDRAHDLVVIAKRA